MKIRHLSSAISLLLGFYCFGQNKIDVHAVFNIENKQIKISQNIQYQNTSQDTLQSIYLNNWANSYATKTTPLAKRIADEYRNDFHLAKNEERGFSILTSVKSNDQDLKYHDLKGQIDIVKVLLDSTLLPGESYNIHLDYIVQLPSDKFTGYGITKTGDLNLKYWYITPAIYNGEWQYYSNKDLNDLFIPKTDVSLKIECPKSYTITSDLDLIKESQNNDLKSVTLEGKTRTVNKLFLNKTSKFNTVETKDFSIVSDIDDEDLEIIDKVLINEKIIKYITKKFGDYPHEKLLVTQTDYDDNPVYGLNFLPSFINTYPNNFKYEVKLLKVTLHNYLENTLLINPRKDQWLIDGIEIFYLMNYVEEHYPNMKFLGSLANFWGVRSFHAADMRYNDKYNLAFMLMARTNRDQPLTMAKDSLLKFNANIANKYKAGIGLNYLDDFVNSHIVENTIESFVAENKLKPINSSDFETYLKSKTNKNIDWFFNDYLSTREKLDFKIKKVSKTKDSVTLTIKNKRHNNMPVSLYTLNNDSVISKIWIENISNNKTLTIPRDEANKLVLNYNSIIPEINERDNWKSLKGFFFNNKPLQFRLFKDIEDPYYNQVFLMPLLEFNNIYDGFTLGMKAYNKTLLRKRFSYKLSPQYAFKSRSFTGSGVVSMTHNLENRNLYAINYGFFGGYHSYAPDLFVRQFTPSLSLYFRQDDDFRSNKRHLVSFRYLDIHRDKDANNIYTTDEPSYNVFNARYVHSNDNLINYTKWYTDLQIAKTFSKVAFNFEYRHLFQNNRQLNLRSYTGVFLSNRNDINSDYFSFALDRPTDYLFEYPYLGRSESSGIFSQQYIEAEGGFKSKLETPFANQWISTVNMSTTLWRYILAYWDIGYVKNKYSSAEFVYDSGIRINLVTDYFEVYFPIYSNLGWEVSQPKYEERIRFKFTLDPQVLLGLFRRRWF
ncbi:gluzincin family metallopeptidase [Aestuariibaculum lutulentum]|uniref:Metalloprotease n=1 Tax=Aestuariibaculum lutulentum TaxID=2920935 RepID=A0ABS9RK85_9FLAO|nr:metalloprotease [Aestuariibaculum lutulentum]MCH4553358.1 metalloprotease [Aestuariibaculum lutulentum]